MFTNFLLQDQVVKVNRMKVIQPTLPLRTPGLQRTPQ